MRLTERDIRTFEAIQRHWWLPSHYLYEFTKDVAVDEYGHRKSLKRLVDAGYLERPLTLNNPMVKNDFLNYALADKAVDALAKLGRKYHYTTPPSGGFAHAGMTVAITANIELEATKASIPYIPQEDIIAKAHVQKLSLPCEISYKGQRSSRPTVPDQLFGLQYPSGYRFFAVEADRGTEPVEPIDLKRNSVLRKILSYKDILIKGTYRKQWNIPNLTVLFVTTSPDRRDNILALIGKVYPNGAANLLLKDLPGFYVFFRSPPLLPKLWTEPWARAGHPPFDMSSA